MQLDLALHDADRGAPWWPALVRVGAAWALLIALTAREWRQMAHQWWDIDTYNHILIVPPILVWLVWLRRHEVAKVIPAAWSPGLAWLGLGLLIWLAGRFAEVNLVAQTGALVALQGVVVALLGARPALVLAFPLAFSLFLVPFGDELIPVMQHVTARIAVTLAHISGVPAMLEGLYIDTPAGRFVVAEECSGVKFLVAMIAIAVLIAGTRMASWKRRIALVVGAALISVVANGVRAWGTIFVAQWVGPERAGGFDHIVYGWVFFAVVIGALLGVAWRFFEREPHEAGLTAAEANCHPLARSDRSALDPNRALAVIASLAIGFAVLAALV